MDFVKKAASSLGNKEDKPQGENKPADGQQGGQPAGGDAQKEDYLDKAFDAGSKKFGYNVDRDTSEKITDGARGAFEKATGKHVPEKFSN